MIALVTTYAVVWFILAVYVAGVTHIERRIEQRRGVGHERADEDA